PTVARIVGMMIASMIAVELIRIIFSALPTGPTGLSTPRLHPEARSTRDAASPARIAALRMRMLRSRSNEFTSTLEPVSMAKTDRYAHTAVDKIGHSGGWWTSKAAPAAEHIADE